MYKLVHNSDGDWVIKFRENGKVVYITADNLNLTSWELYYQYINNRQQVLEMANEYLILNNKLEN